MQPEARSDCELMSDNDSDHAERDAALDHSDKAESEAINTESEGMSSESDAEDTDVGIRIKSIADIESAGIRVYLSETRPEGPRERLEEGSRIIRLGVVFEEIPERTGPKSGIEHDVREVAEMSVLALPDGNTFRALATMDDASDGSISFFRLSPKQEEAVIALRAKAHGIRQNYQRWMKLSASNKSPDEIQAAFTPEESILFGRDKGCICLSKALHAHRIQVKESRAAKRQSEWSEEVIDSSSDFKKAKTQHKKSPARKVIDRALARPRFPPKASPKPESAAKNSPKPERKTAGASKPDTSATNSPKPERKPAEVNSPRPERKRYPERKSSGSPQPPSRKRPAESSEPQTSGSAESSRKRPARFSYEPRTPEPSEPRVLSRVTFTVDITESNCARIGALIAALGGH